MSIFNVFTLMGGIAMFLYGMDLMGKALEQTAGSKLQGILSKMTASPVRDHVAAVSVGIVQGTPLLDLEYVEDVDCDTDMNVVMTGAGHYVEVQGTAEGVAFTRAEMDQLLGLAEQGIAQLVQLQQQALQNTP